MQEMPNEQRLMVGFKNQNTRENAYRKQQNLLSMTTKPNIALSQPLFI